MLRYIILLSLVSCITVVREQTKPKLMQISQCYPPTWIILDDGLAVYEKQVVEAIGSWNIATRIRLFTFGGVSDIDNLDPPIPFVTISQNDFRTKCGKTKITHTEGQSCFSKAKIQISLSCLDKFHSVVLHELGHIAGLDDINDSTYIGIMRNRIQAVPISDEEAELVRKRYYDAE